MAGRAGHHVGYGAGTIVVFRLAGGMRKKVYVTHQLPGERVHDLVEYCDLSIWTGEGLLSGAERRQNLAAARRPPRGRLWHADPGLESMPASELRSSPLGIEW